MEAPASGACGDGRGQIGASLLEPCSEQFDSGAARGARPPGVVATSEKGEDVVGARSWTLALRAGRGEQVRLRGVDTSSDDGGGALEGQGECEVDARGLPAGLSGAKAQSRVKLRGVDTTSEEGEARVGLRSRVGPKLRGVDTTSEEDEGCVRSGDLGGRGAAARPNPSIKKVTLHFLPDGRPKKRRRCPVNRIRMHKYVYCGFVSKWMVTI